MPVVAGNWTSISEMLHFNSTRFGSSPALMGEDGVRISHEELYARVRAIVQSLNQSGIGCGDRIAIVMPPGPDLAIAFLAVSAGATSGPLNPAYLEKEFEYHLRDLTAKALIVLKGSDSPARTAAKHLGIPIVELISLSEEGWIAGVPGGSPCFAEADDVALVLHTSGTTSRPKRVPLSHANLCASARNIAATLQLGSNDVSLSTMPLFHIHGLACLLAALSVGGSCVCAPSFQPDRFSAWLEAWGPTWLSAVPTALRALLDFARDRSLAGDRSFAAGPLRFMRSSSAALPPTVMAGLETLFGVPVIESYGMTEASHQMASNPLPPRTRKPGSVGLPAGPKVAILDELGALLEIGSTGEVAIMGPGVTLGYENNPEADAKAFSAGWFRTGDQGYFDQDGYLFITGRLKEAINRGGEKIAPREIDEALLAFPSVRQAVAFAVPHPSLGEDVVAAVVLQDGARCDEAELRSFLLDSLPAFKVPTRIIFLDDVPKGPTGKVQRIGMAARLAQFLTLDYEAPSSEMEQLIADTIGQVLARERVGRADNFFMLGGDSLRATRVLIRLGQTLSLELPVPLLFRLPTPALLAQRLDQLVASREVDDLAAALADLPLEEQLRLLKEAEDEAEQPVPIRAVGKPAVDGKILYD